MQKLLFLRTQIKIKFISISLLITLFLVLPALSKKYPIKGKVYETGKISPWSKSDILLYDSSYVEIHNQIQILPDAEIILVNGYSRFNTDTTSKIYFKLTAKSDSTGNFDFGKVNFPDSVSLGVFSKKQGYISGSHNFRKSDLDSLDNIKVFMVPLVKYKK